MRRVSLNNELWDDDDDFDYVHHDDDGRDNIYYNYP